MKLLYVDFFYSLLTEDAKKELWEYQWKKELHLFMTEGEAVCKAVCKPDPTEVFNYIFSQVSEHVSDIYCVNSLFYYRKCIILHHSSSFCHKDQYFPYWKSHITSVISVAFMKLQCYSNICS